jgi:hypothetical protein
MPISQLVYLSRATMNVDRTELFDIASISMANNRAADVTGALLFCDGYFLQILEGEPAVLTRTLEKISQDLRHVDVQVLERRDNVARSFADWEMACLHEASMTDAQSARARACIAMVQRDELVDRIGNDAHQLLVDLRDAIASESATLVRDAA